MPHLMLDLCSGLGGASQAMIDRGWDVVRVELDQKFNPDIVADVREFHWGGQQPYLIWASPPCTEFSRESMPWFRTGNPPSMELVLACKRIIDECNPMFWVIENVKGAIRYFRPLFGPPKKSCGPFFLWGNFPDFNCRIKFFKERLSSKQQAERAKVPYLLSERLAEACESNLFAECV